MVPAIVICVIVIIGENNVEKGSFAKATPINVYNNNMSRNNNNAF